MVIEVGLPNLDCLGVQAKTGGCNFSESTIPKYERGSNQGCFPSLIMIGIQT